jgi:DNA (cytosine-5)-methyltransferase 1
LGDICKISGAEIEIVDVITGGSPCQDLSIAGKRAGLAGARSGLFMAQIRIVKEMREHDRANGRTGDMVRPRFMVWENVPGAFSSNKGRDFAAVLEEIIRIAEPEAPDIDVPEKGWPSWGGYHDEVGGRWSVAWRVHDAQHWGVPQRRRRISVVADFGGDTAGEILFERKSVSRHPAESGTARERLAGDAQDGASYAVRIRGGCDGGGKGALVQEEKSGTLGTGNDQTIFCMETQRDCGEIVPSLQARMGTGGNQVPLTYQQTTGTLSPGAHAGSYNGQDAYNDMLVVSSEISPTLRAKGNDQYREDMAAYIASVDCRNFCEGGETNGTLQAKSNGGISYNLQNTIRTGTVARRLTPMECERLQGFPDGWTDIGEWRDSKGKLRKPSDSPRYKALGNSIALPFWDFLAKRISAQYLRPVTMGSLFDGIGGFPLVFERHNGKGTARWASEIEEFPIAVTKLRFGED